MIQQTMRKSLIIIAVIGVMLCVVGAVLFAIASASPNTPAVNSAVPQVDVQPSQIACNPGGPMIPSNFTFTGNFTFPGNFAVQGGFGFQGRMMHGMHGRQTFGPQLSGEFLQNATIASVSGSVVTETRGLLLLDTSSGQVSIQIPSEWNIGSQVISGCYPLQWHIRHLRTNSNSASTRKQRVQQHKLQPQRDGWLPSHQFNRYNSNCGIAIQYTIH